MQLRKCETIVFQQDSAPAQRAHETVQLLQKETPDLWPLTVQIFRLTIRFGDGYRTPVEDTSQSKQHLIDTWSTISQSIIDDAIDK